RQAVGAVPARLCPAPPLVHGAFAAWIQERHLLHGQVCGLGKRRDEEGLSPPSSETMLRASEFLRGSFYFEPLILKICPQSSAHQQLRLKSDTSGIDASDFSGYKAFKSGGVDGRTGCNCERGRARTRADPPAQFARACP